VTAPDVLLTQAEVAEWLRVPASTLKTWRTRGGGPPAVKFGRHVRYERLAVEAWIRSRTEARTPAPVAAPAPARPAARRAVGESRPSRPMPAVPVPARLEVVR